MADSGYKNVSRIDSEKKNMHGWYVRIFHKGQYHAKYFNDNKSGGTEEALQDAVEYRNQLEEELGKPRTERYIISGLHPHNNTGVPGVNRKMTKQKKRGKWYTWEVFEVTWNPRPGKVSRTTVSIHKHGEEEAFRRACAIREKKLAEICAAYREPGTAQQEPEPAHREPAVAHREPEVAHREPAVAHREPEVAHPEPEVAHRKPPQEHPYIKWIKHNNNEILTVDYGNLATTSLPAVSKEVAAMVKQGPDKVRLLYNVAGTSTLNETMDHINQTGKEILPYTEKVAIAGVSGLKAQLFKAYSLFGRSTFTLFGDEDKALDWLAR